MSNDKIQAIALCTIMRRIKPGVVDAGGKILRKVESEEVPPGKIIMLDRAEFAEFQANEAVCVPTQQEVSLANADGIVDLGFIRALEQAARDAREAEAPAAIVSFLRAALMGKGGRKVGDGLFLGRCPREGATSCGVAPVPILADAIMAEREAAADTANRERWALLAEVGVMTGCYRMIVPAILSGLDGRTLWFLSQQLH